MVSFGYLYALVSFLIRHLSNNITALITGFFLFFFYQITNSFSDHLIHLATGLNPDYFDNSHYFITILVGATLP